MRWQERRRSDNVEDLRGRPGRKGLAVGGIGGIIIAVLYFLLGGDPQQMLQTLQGPQTDSAQQETVELTDSQRQMGEFVSVVLADTEDVWHDLFQRQGRQYREPKLVLFSQSVDSACGFAQAATGPFYCGGDEKVYMDLDFFDELQRRLGFGGDFACAYIIAHEVGHHVQNQLGILDKLAEARESMSERDFNRYQVRNELQADFLAGVWAHHAQKSKKMLEAGDIDEALTAAGAVGDDRIQKMTRGQVVPDSFTHGTSAQRIHWFRKGFETGDLSQGDTFSADID
jgi:predicted metalloprotease